MEKNVSKILQGKTFIFLSSLNKASAITVKTSSVGIVMYHTDYTVSYY